LSQTGRIAIGISLPDHSKGIIKVFKEKGFVDSYEAILTGYLKRKSRSGDKNNEQGEEERNRLAKNDCLHRDHCDAHQV
jgi:hypothetical protein